MRMKTAADSSSDDDSATVGPDDWKEVPGLHIYNA